MVFSTNASNTTIPLALHATQICISLVQLEVFGARMSLGQEYLEVCKQETTCDAAEASHSRVLKEVSYDEVDESFQNRTLKVAILDDDRCTQNIRKRSRKLW